MTNNWDFRALDISKKKKVYDPSGHELREVRGTGSVKYHPRKIFNLADFAID